MSSRSNVVALPSRGIARARLAIGSRAAAYERDPSVVSARELILGVQAWWHHLDAMGVGEKTSDAFLGMNASDADEKMVLLCANAILRALRVAAEKKDASWR